MCMHTYLVILEIFVRGGYDEDNSWSIVIFLKVAVVFSALYGQAFQDWCSLAVCPSPAQLVSTSHNYPSLIIIGLNQIYEMWVQSLAWEDPLDESVATHSSILAWRNPWSEEPSRLQFTGLQRHDWSDLACMQSATAYVPAPAPTTGFPGNWWSSFSPRVAKIATTSCLPLAMQDGMSLQDLLLQAGKIPYPVNCYMNLLLFLSSFFGLESGQLQGLQSCRVYKHTYILKCL